jgi:hypothetical protein
MRDEPCCWVKAVGGKVQASSVRSSSRWYRNLFPCWRSQLRMDTACLSGRVLLGCGGVVEFLQWRLVVSWCCFVQDRAVSDRHQMVQE